MNKFLILAFSTFFVLACETDQSTGDITPDTDNKNDPNNYAPRETEHEGSASFVVSGDIEGEYSGIAYFRPYEMKGMHSWGITLTDQKPKTFTISFAQTSGKPIAPPEVGTYKLGINPGNRHDDIYLTSFEYFESEPFKRSDYSVGFGETSGVLEITTSTDELIEGNFSFTAVRLEKGAVAGKVEVTDGEFSAVLTR